MNAEQPPETLLESRPDRWLPEVSDFARIGVDVTERFNPARCRWEIQRAIKSGWIEPAPPPPPPPADPAPGPEEDDTPPPHPCRNEDGSLDVAAIRRAVEVGMSRGWIEGPSQPKDTERTHRHE